MFETLGQYLTQGGAVMPLIFLACFAMLYTGAGKWLELRQYRRRVVLSAGNELTAEAVRRDWFLRELLHPFDRCSNVSPAEIRECLLRHIPRLERGFDTIGTWISVAPLLGLLGTVIGMVKTFRLIMLFGIGNPHILAEGISVALLTTQAGLLVSFPGLLMHNRLSAAKDAIVKSLLADGEKLQNTGSRHVR